MRSLWTWQIFVPWFRLVWTPSRSTGALLDLVWLVSINGAIRRRVEKGSVETNFGRVCFLPEHDAEVEIWTRGSGLALSPDPLLPKKMKGRSLASSLRSMFPFPFLTYV